MKILIVEDEAASRELLEIYISKQGYDYRSACDGTEALDILKQYKPDIVISDIRMPNMDGIELLKQIKQFELHTIVIIVTAHGNTDIVLDVMNLGANNYIKKPIKLNELNRLLNKYKQIIEVKEFNSNISNFIQKQEIRYTCNLKHEMIPVISSYVSQHIYNIYNTEVFENLKLGIKQMLYFYLDKHIYGISAKEKELALETMSIEDFYEKNNNLNNETSIDLNIEFYFKEDYCDWCFSAKNNISLSNKEIDSELRKDYQLDTYFDYICSDKENNMIILRKQINK